MARRYRGGFLTPNPPALGIPPNTYGVTNLAQEFQARGQNIWPNGPSAPTIVSTYPGGSQALINFTAPSSAGYVSPVASYKATSTPGNITGTSTASPMVVTGLTNGTSYTFDVVAINSGNVVGEIATTGSVTPANPTYYIVSYSKSPDPNGAQGALGYDASSDKLYEGINGATGGYPAISRVSYGSFTTDYSASFSTSYAFNPYVMLPNSTMNNIVVTGVQASYSNSIDIKAFSNLTVGTSSTWAKTTYSYAPNGSQIYNGSSYRITRDSAGDIYVCGYGNGSGANYNAFLFKLNGSTGAKVFDIWDTASVTYVDNYLFNGVAVANSGNIYCVGSWTASGGSQVGGVLVKFDSSGNLLWAKQWQGSSGYGWDTARENSIVIDSSENIYINGVNSATYMTTAKFDSSGNNLWTRQFQYGGGAFATAGYLALDLSNNLYIYVTGGFFSDYEFAKVYKYNSSGVLQWQRNWVATGVGYFYYIIPTASQIIIGNDGSLCYGSSGISTGGSSDYGYPTFYKTPADGSHTGSYTVRGITLTYAATSVTETSATLTNLTSSGVSFAFGSSSQSTAASTSINSFSTTSTSTTI